jgi:predicted Ser/Thr protein kinase
MEHKPEAALNPGEQLGPYKIEALIGKGGMGSVYKGTDTRLGRPVAIKVSAREFSDRFEREARAISSLNHPNICTLYDVGPNYLVMEFVEGETLSHALKQGPLPLDKAVHYSVQIADALDAAHAKGVVHRDLKPDNIVLSDAKPPKIFVLDFGIAKLVSKANEGDTKKAGPGTLTGQGTWLGTPSYMAPEQWSIDGAGPASDRYALGVIAFELLAGAPPFSATSVPGMMEQHFRTPVPPLSSRGAVGVPPAIDKVLERALSKDPDARFATAKDFVEALRDAAGTGAYRARGAVERMPTQRRPWLPAVAGVGVLGVAVAAYVATRGGETPVVTPKQNDPAVQPGQIAIEILSEPAGADVKTDHIVGTTPMKLPLAPGVQTTLVVAKPGYAPETRTVRAEAGTQPAMFKLAEVTGFNGTWRLKNGELRWFERAGEQVDVYKLTEVDGHREFFKHYKFAAADKGVAFAADDEVVDSRKPDDPSCHVPVHVEYRYDAEADVLELRRETVTIDFHDGGCVVRARHVDTDLLVHVDRPVDEREIAPPVGLPPKHISKQKMVVPKDPQAELDKQLELDKATKVTKPVTTSNVGKKSSVSDN